MPDFEPFFPFRLARNYRRWLPSFRYYEGEKGLSLTQGGPWPWYQDVAGSVIANRPGDPVGLWKDRSGLGNHATQSVALSRPRLARHPSSGLRQLLSNSTSFSSSSWTTLGLTLTAVQVSGDIYGVTAPAEAQRYGIYDVTNAAWIISSAAWPISSGRFSAQFTTPANCTSIRVYPSRSNDANVYAYQTVPVAPSTIYTMSLHINGAAFGGCQVETGTVRTGYQAATSAYDVSEAGYGYIWGLRTDGIDDWLATQVINWGTDEVTVVAAVRKNSDASEGSIMAFTGGGAGEFRMVGPGGNTSFKFWSASKGATETFAVASSGAYSAPISAVVSMQGKIGTDTNNLWINGTLAATSSGDQGVAATYGKHQLRIGRLSGTSFPFNGMIYGLMVINRLLTPTERSRAERYMAALSGVTIP